MPEENPERRKESVQEMDSEPESFQPIIDETWRKSANLAENSGEQMRNSQGPGKAYEILPGLDISFGQAGERQATQGKNSSDLSSQSQKRMDYAETHREIESIPRGANLYDISKSHLQGKGEKVSDSSVWNEINRIARLNGIDDPDVIRAGARLKLETGQSLKDFKDKLRADDIKNNRLPKEETKDPYDKHQGPDKTKPDAVKPAPQPPVELPKDSTIKPAPQPPVELPKDSTIKPAPQPPIELPKDSTVTPAPQPPVELPKDSTVTPAPQPKVEPPNPIPKEQENKPVDQSRTTDKPLDPKIAEIDKKYPFSVDSLKVHSRYDEIFKESKEIFKEKQAAGQVPTERQLFEQAKAAAVPGQRFFEASVPYWTSKDGRQAVGENYMWDDSGRLISQNYWRRGGGDQLGRGKDVTIYHNIEGVNAGGTDIGWINQSTNEALIKRGGNPPIDMHGRSMSSGTSAGCEAHPSGKDYPNWMNFREKMHYAIKDNESRGLRPFASHHVGTQYAIKSGMDEKLDKFKPPVDSNNKPLPLPPVEQTKPIPAPIDNTVPKPVPQDKTIEKDNETSRHKNTHDRAKDNAQIVAKVAKELGVDPVLAVATMLVESGGNHKIDGDNGASHGLFQLNDYGEMKDNYLKRTLTKDEAYDPETNARVALNWFKKVQDQQGLSGGRLAAAAQRPADREGFAYLVEARMSDARKLLSDSTKPSEEKKFDYSKIADTRNWSESQKRMVAAAESSVDEKMWRYGGWSDGSVDGGNLGCAGSVSGVLKLAGYNGGLSAGANELGRILQKDGGWNKILQKDDLRKGRVQAGDIKPGDIIVWQPGDSGHGHIGTVVPGKAPGMKELEYMKENRKVEVKSNSLSFTDLARNELKSRNEKNDTDSVKREAQRLAELNGMTVKDRLKKGMQINTYDDKFISEYEKGLAERSAQAGPLAGLDFVHNSSGKSKAIKESLESRLKDGRNWYLIRPPEEICRPDLSADKQPRSRDDSQALRLGEKFKVIRTAMNQQESELTKLAYLQEQERKQQSASPVILAQVQESKSTKSEPGASRIEPAVSQKYESPIIVPTQRQEQDLLHLARQKQEQEEREVAARFLKEILARAI